MQYYEALVAERSMTLANTLRQVAGQALEASELRPRALEGAQQDVLRSQVESENTQLPVIDATNRRDAAGRRLSSISGGSVADVPKLDDEFAAPLPALDW